VKLFSAFASQHASTPLGKGSSSATVVADMSAPPTPSPSPFRDNVLAGKVTLVQIHRTRTGAPMASKTEQQRRVQVALITGGGSGIGYEITRQLGERPGLVHVECMDYSL